MSGCNRYFLRSNHTFLELTLAPKSKSVACQGGRTLKFKALSADLCKWLKQERTEGTIQKATWSRNIGRLRKLLVDQQMRLRAKTKECKVWFSRKPKPSTRNLASWKSIQAYQSKHSHPWVDLTWLKSRLLPLSMKTNGTWKTRTRHLTPMNTETWSCTNLQSSIPSTMTLEYH